MVSCRTPNASAVEKVPITRREADVANFMAMRMLALCTIHNCNVGQTPNRPIPGNTPNSRHFRDYIQLFTYSFSTNLALVSY